MEGGRMFELTYTKKGMMVSYVKGEERVLLGALTFVDDEGQERLVIREFLKAAVRGNTMFVVREGDGVESAF
jgi:hypothetical protein